MLTLKLALRAVGVLVIAVAAVAGAAGRGALEPSVGELVSTATDLTANQRGHAEPVLRRILARSPDNPEACWLLGVLFASREDHLGALACFRRIPNSHSQWSKSKLAEGDELFQLGDAVLAEATWNSALSTPQTQLDVRQRLLGLYGFQLRRQEWAAALQELIKAGRTSLREMVQLVIIGHVIWQGEGIVETLEKFVAVNPEDAVSRASLVQHLLAAGQSDEARKHLNVLLENPSRTPFEAYAVIAFATAEAKLQIVESYVASAPAEWRARLQNDPTWLRGLGELELQRGAVVKAASLLDAAARKEPFHPGGRQQLALALRLLGRMEEANPHAAAADVLARLDRNAHAMQTAGTWSADGAIEMSRDAASVGMVEEARAWLHFAQRDAPDRRFQQLLDKANALPPTSRERPPATFLDPRRELQRW